MARASEPASRPQPSAPGQSGASSPSASSLDDAARTRRLPAGARLGAVLSTYHRDVTGAMLDSARAELTAAGLDAGPGAAGLVTIEVPGAFEIPIVARALAVRDDIQAVLCFGLVLKGETSHDQHIAAAVSQALQRVSLDVDKPVLFGVLTCATLEQAQARALSSERGGRHDKGREVARAALDVLEALERARAPEASRPRAGFGVAIRREGTP